MKYRRMGKTGLKLSEISLGAWNTFGDQIDDRTASDAVHAAYDRGVNFFDNADIYAHGQAEIVMGKALKDLPRESLVLSSKVFNQVFEGVNGRGLSRKHIMEACHASLRRLGTDYLDIYFCHQYDPETPLEEVVRAMDDLIHQGKVLYWGTSNWHVGQFANAYRLACQSGLYPPVVEQPQYNMAVRRKVEQEFAPAASELGFGLVTWSPLRSGLLSGKYNDTAPEDARLSLEKHQWRGMILNEAGLAQARKLNEAAVDLGVTLAQLAIGWLLRTPQVTSVITGATRVAHVEQNVKAIEIPEKLTPEVLERIDEILGPGPEPQF